MVVARPTSRVSRARPDTTTAPSRPTKSHTSDTIVELICSPKARPPGSPVKWSRNTAGSNFAMSGTHRMKSASGTSLASVMTRLTPAATLTPRERRKASSHRKAEAQTMAGTLLPPWNTGKKYERALKSITP